MSKSYSKTEQWKSLYHEIKEIGEGGNAKVFMVEDIATGENVALKSLIKRSEEKKQRFLLEIEVMESTFEEIEGILPIIHYDKNDFWYTMPVASLALEHIEGIDMSFIEVVKATISLGATLTLLHEKKIYHRDIKPSNIYYLNDRFCLGDFGLVNYEERHDITKSDVGVGAIFTISPEMKRNPKTADGEKADVFSLAKTLWMLLTREQLGFDGQYNQNDDTYALKNFMNYRGEHLVELEELLSISTNNNPNIRPTMKDFIAQLQAFTEIHSNSSRVQQSQWLFLKKNLLGDNDSGSTIWRKPEIIVEKLKILSSLSVYNHMFIDSGGLDFKSAQLANEKDFIYIFYTDGVCFLLKPKRLIFESFDNYEWNYFFLELEKISPIFSEEFFKVKKSYEDDGMRFVYERLVEDYPSHYVNSDDFLYGVYDYDSGKPLPKESKLVYRHTEGNFLITLKTGPYNKIPLVYDGRHNLCNGEEFRRYIDKLIEIVCDLLEEGYLEENILRNKQFGQNPFIKNEKKCLTEITKTKKIDEIDEDTVINMYNSISFNDVLINDINDGAVKYSFILNTSCNSFSFEDVFCDSLKDKYFLCKDGYIKKKSSDSNEIYYAPTLSNAKEILEFLKKSFQKLCENNNILKKSTGIYFEPKIHKNGKPTHLFTLNEITKLVTEADDRRNNRLVIDGSGYPHLIQEPDDYTALYPVRNEVWNSRNGYTGKYADLSHLKSAYLASLEGWLFYLESGECSYRDYFFSNDDKGLLEKIKKFY